MKVLVITSADLIATWLAPWETWTYLFPDPGSSAKRVVVKREPRKLIVSGGTSETMTSFITGLQTSFARFPGLHELVEVCTLENGDRECHRCTDFTSLIAKFTRTDDVGGIAIAVKPLEDFCVSRAVLQLACCQLISCCSPCFVKISWLMHGSAVVVDPENEETPWRLREGAYGRLVCVDGKRGLDALRRPLHPQLAKRLTHPKFPLPTRVTPVEITEGLKSANIVELLWGRLRSRRISCVGYTGLLVEHDCGFFPSDNVVKLVDALIERRRLIGLCIQAPVETVFAWAGGALPPGAKRASFGPDNFLCFFESQKEIFDLVPLPRAENIQIWKEVRESSPYQIAMFLDRKTLHLDVVRLLGGIFGRDWDSCIYTTSKQVYENVPGDLLDAVTQ